MATSSYSPSIYKVPPRLVLLYLEERRILICMNCRDNEVRPANSRHELSWRMGRTRMPRRSSIQRAYPIKEEILEGPPRCPKKAKANEGFENVLSLRPRISISTH